MTSPDNLDWIATTATVTSCRYQSRALSSMAFGVPFGEKFRITFDYYAHGRLYSDELQSPIAIPQNEILPLTYNPLDPRQNSRTNTPTSKQGNPPLLAIGIAGSILLSLAWLAILRGCR